MEKKKSSNTGILVVGVKFVPKLISVLGKLLKSAKLIKVGLATASLVSYSYLFTWQFAAMIIVMLFVHESGHVWAMKKKGIKTKGFYFIPFLGGAAIPEESFKTRSNEAYIAVMGPIWGLLISVGTFAVYYLTDNPIFAAGASWMAMVNLLNLIPVNPLDGGRITKSIVLSMGQRSERFKKIPFIVLLSVSAVILIIIANAGLWLFFFFVCIGFLDILFEFFSNKSEMTPMPLGERIKYLAYTLCLAFVLYLVMDMTEHIPGANIAMDFLRDK